MLCDDVKRVVYFFLDGSLGDQKRRDFTMHLTLCPPCEERMKIQSRLRDFVRKRLAPVKAPDHLRSRLAQSLHSAG